MATAEKIPRRIVQQAIKPSEPPGCVITLPTHIQESKKLIKRNGETVEIVTLTLTTTPKVGHPEEEEQITTTTTTVEKQQQRNTSLQLQSSLDSTAVSTFASTDVTNASNDVTISTTVNDSDSSTTTFEDATKLLLAETSTTTTNQNLVVSSSSTETPLVPSTSSTEEFIIVTSAPSDFANNGNNIIDPSSHGKLTFITAPEGNSAEDAPEIVAVPSHTSDDITTSASEGTTGMTSQNMSLVQMVDAAELAQSSSGGTAVVTGRGASSVNLLDDYSYCLICGDKGSGFHYSVFSCEGCKGFFKRSVQKNLTYTCKNDGNCDINRFSRNNCQYCRFKKCLQFGMKKEGVRDDRTPGGLTRARFKRMRLPDNDLPATESKQSQYQLESDIQLLVNCDPYISPSFVTTEEKTATLYGAFQLTAILYDDLIYIVKWAKQVLGFRTLELQDQKRLLESSSIELSLFRLAYRSFASEEGKLRFAHDIELTLSEAQQLGFDADYIDALLELIDRLKDLEIDDKEYAILCAIILFYEDTVGLRDTITVLKMQQKYLTILQRYIRLVYGGDLKRYGRMLLRLPGLRTIAMKIDEVFEQFIVADRLTMSQMIDSALLDHIEEHSLDQMVITSADIQLDETGIISSAEVETVTDTVEDVVDHVAIA